MLKSLIAEIGGINPSQNHATPVSEGEPKANLKFQVIKDNIHIKGDNFGETCQK